MSGLARAAALAAVVVVAAGCGGARTAPDHADDRDPLAPRSLYPLAAGRVWSYDVDTGDGLSTLAITRVVSVRGPRVEVSSGSDPVVYEVGPEGIAYPGRDAWLLRAPIAEGATWPGRAGRRATVTDVDATIEVPAGRFRGCVVVAEADPATGRRIRTTYCPFVGPVEVRSELTLDVAGGVQRATARLLGTNVDGDLDGGPDGAPGPGDEP